MKNVTRRKERMSLRSGWGAWIEEEGEEGGLGGWDERCPQKPVFYTFRGPHLAGNPHAERGKQKHRTSLVDWLLSRSNVMLARCGACPERVSAPASVAPNGKHDKNELPDGLASTTCRATSTNLPVTVGAHVKDSMRPDTFTCACKARFTVDTSGYTNHITKCSKYRAEHVSSSQRLLEAIKRRKLRKADAEEQRRLQSQLDDSSQVGQAELTSRRF